MPSNFGIRDPRDFAAGLFFLVCGVAIFWMARQYPTGTLLSMGPSFYPTALSIILIVVGIIFSAAAFSSAANRSRPALGVLAVIVIPIATSHP